MARIPTEEIERLKNDISLERLIEAAGISLKKSGKDKIGACPFHEDSEPSLVVTPAKNLWHCFSCQIGGSPIDWVMKFKGISFRHAVELLKADPALAAEVVGAMEAPVKRSDIRSLPPPVTFDADDNALLTQTIAYYHETLKQSPEALAYLQARGLTHPDLISHFQLGYANRTLGLRLPDKTRKAGADIRTRLEKIGIYRQSGHEHFNGSLIVPVLDAEGHVSEVYGRKIHDNLRKGTPVHLYLPGPHRGVWNSAALQTSTEIILCESLIDAMTFWCAGYRNVTAAYGVEGFTDDHLSAFKTHGIQRVLIAYDRDDAGERASTKLAERLLAEGIDCYRIAFPKDMDANDYAQKVGPATKSLGVLIRKAVWLGQGRAAHTDEEGAHSSPAGLASLEMVVPTDAATLQQPQQAPPQPAPSATQASTLPAPSVPDSSYPVLPASPIPATPATIKPDSKANEVYLSYGEGRQQRRYRLRGLDKNLAVAILKVNLMVTVGEAFYVDTLDLYAAKQRQGYVLQAAMETGVDDKLLKSDLGKLLLACEQLQDEQIQKALHAAPVQRAMPEHERDAALALLKSPDLIRRILADYALCGLVGEETNKLVGYLACVSRKLHRPLGIVIQSSSAAGKTSLMDAVLAFVPEEDKVKYSAMTGQSLFYMGESNLKHKALAIVEEEGASKASYALKLLQSEGELTIASTGKDPNTGNLITQQYRVEGPVALLVTTTARDIDEELLNRCLVLTVDESRDQTRAIHQLQRNRRTLEGLIAQHDKDAVIALHQNAQSLLKAQGILNPYARFLSFPDQTTRLRRDHEKYLTLIDTIAFVHQYQRPCKSVRHGQDTLDYIEVTLDDIALANRIAHDVLGRSLDELPPQTRRLLRAIDAFVLERATAHDVPRSDILFSRRTLREAINWGDTQLKIHLARLVELEYIVAYRTRTNGFNYELVYDVGSEGDTLRFPGLTDIDTLARAYDAARSGQTAPQSAPSRGVVGPQSVVGQEGPSSVEPAGQPPARKASPQSSDAGHLALLRSNGKDLSYPHTITV